MDIYDKVIKATDIVKENVVPKRCNNCGGLEPDYMFDIIRGSLI